MALNRQLTGNAGRYYTCYQLSLLGWNVRPTARNARGVDITAYSQDATRKLTIQVKALTKRDAVPLGTSLEKVMGGFWVEMNKLTSSAPSVFIMLPAEVKSLAQRREKEGRLSFWLQLTSYDQESFKEKWECIGHG
ncbi:MAG TPA: hypothetical protein DEA22_02985 [Blastocatellia bacterium]|nr:hypothetical protein [Blastocatellia bacterium]